MKLEEQEALLTMWREFLDGERPTAALMRTFYFDIVSHSRHYRYGMAPELFDLLINGTFEVKQSTLWASAQGGAGGHRAA